MLERTRLLVVIHAQLTLSHFHTMTVLTVPVPYSVVPVQYSMAYSSADPQGVGPAQNWYVVADGVNDKFHYEFGLKGEYGAPTSLDGHVPQVYATWVNGLTPGRYYARAWVFRYVQTGLDGSTFQEYPFQVSANEWAGDIALPMDLRISSWINKTVHFHDNAGTLSTNPISTGAQVLVGTLTGATSGILYSYNQTFSSQHLQHPKLLSCNGMRTHWVTRMSRSTGSMILGWERITVSRLAPTSHKSSVRLHTANAGPGLRDAQWDSDPDQ